MDDSVIVDPSGSYTGDHFLDVQYIADPDPGAVVLDEGTWQLADVKWFRLACVDPVKIAYMDRSLWRVAYPACTDHGVQLDTPLVIENFGNENLWATVDVVELTGPTGWLTLSAELADSIWIPYGPDNSISGVVQINTGGIVDDPGTNTRLVGEVVFTGNFMTSPDTLSIDVMVGEATYIDHVQPDHHTNGVPDTYWAFAFFNRDMEPSSFDESTVRLHSRTLGPLDISIAYQPDSSVDINPVGDLPKGDLITAELTAGLQTATGQTLYEGYSWSFWSEAEGASGELENDVQYTAGTQPNAIVAGDFNGDGNVDLAVANRASDNVSVLLNAGDGTFGAPSDVGAGDWPTAIDASDIDVDGDLDLVTADYYSNTVTILTNDGSANFTLDTTYDVDGGPRGIVATDMDGDGLPDIAVTQATNGTVSVLISRWDGTHSLDWTVAAGTKPMALTSTDIDEDGQPDLIVADNTGNTLEILMNPSDAHFVNDTSYDVGPAPYSVVAGDFNDDGHVDLASGDYDSHTISVLFGDGSGHFSTAVSYGAGTNPREMAIGDVNGDGDLDLVTANSTVDSISVLENDGSGVFTLAAQYSAGDEPNCVAMANLSDDDRIDVAAGNRSSSNVSVFLNTEGIAVYLDHVDGLNGSDEVVPGQDVTFHIAVSNVSGNPVYQLTNTFLVSGPSCTNWTAATASWNSSINWFNYFSLPPTVEVNSGTCHDSIRFDAFAMSGGLPQGFNDIAWEVTVPVPEDYGATQLCLDSCRESAWAWWWDYNGAFYYPSWGGPYCFDVSSGGCCNIRGDIDHSGILPIDIADLVYLVDYMFSGGPEPPCWDEGDVDGNAVVPIDIADLVYLVDYMFSGGSAPPACP